MSNLYIGTSGWSYMDWVGVFYKNSKRMLSQYCRLFKTVEVDSTFYSIPSLDLIHGIVRTVPRSFKISLKMYKEVTHTMYLGRKGNVKGILENYLRIIDPIFKSGKLGAILIQLPPNFRYDPVTLRNFLELLDHSFRYAVEFRDPSWLKEDVYDLLSRYDVAYTIVDEPLLPPETVLTTDFTYIRWHGRGSRPWYNYRYRREQLEEWADKIMNILDKVDVIYGYFNNHFHGYAVENALELLDMFGLLDEAGRRELERIRKTIDGLASSKRLSRYRPEDVMAMDLITLLTILSDGKRVERGLKISSSEIGVIEAGEGLYRYRIRDYIVVIDAGERVVIHDCADWERVHREKKLCKHLVRILTVMPRKEAVEIARDMALNLDLWTFQFRGEV